MSSPSSTPTKNTLLKNGWKEIPGSVPNMVRKDGFRLEIDYFQPEYSSLPILNVFPTTQQFLINCIEDKNYNHLLRSHITLRHTFPDLYKILMEICPLLPVNRMADLHKYIVISTDHGYMRFSQASTTISVNSLRGELLIMLRQETEKERAAILREERDVLIQKKLETDRLTAEIHQLSEKKESENSETDWVISEPKEVLAPI
jgi:hypothetical protein